MHTFLAPLRRAEECFADRLALVDDERRLTYGEVGVRARRLAGALAARGLRPGDRVAVYAENSTQYAEVTLALPAAGIVVVPLNIRHALPELQAVLEDTAPRLLLTDRFQPEIADALGGAVEQVVVLGDDFERLVAGGPEVGLGAGVHPDDLALIYCTGGTTGRSKGVMLSHANKIHDAFALLSSSRLEHDDVWLVMGPMFHASGSFHIVPCTWVGATQVILRRFEVHAALAAIERHRATVTFGVPTMVRQMTELQRHDPHDLSSLRLLGHGGAPITLKDLQAFHETCPHVELVGMYGATEMGPLATAVEHQERLLGSERFRSCGRAVIGQELAILDDDGRALPVGEVGEIAVRGPAVMMGYWENKEATEAVLHDGWYLSGDVGRLDEQHLLYILDRKKDMIITGGENVYGAEVEDVLIRYPGVVEAAVFGVDDDEWGQVVQAVLVCEEDLDVEAVRTHCRGFLANYKVPKRVRVQRDPLPKSGAGKVLKRELRLLEQDAPHG
jgi:acyl-CoA synthetase (AMP-forming)/AMP-acid ligase II